MASYDELIQGEGGKPFPNLIEHFFPQLDYAEVLRELESIPEEDVERRMKYLADTVPGLPFIADCLASIEQLEEKKTLNATLLNSLGPDQPGIEARAAKQSSPAYKDIFDNFLAKSPVLTRADIEKAKTIPLPSGGSARLFELLKTRSSDASVTEWHWIAHVVTNEGEEHFLEGVWNLYDIPTANKAVLADYYRDATRNFKRMPDPVTTFGRFHGSAIGPEDMTLGGRYAQDKTYAVRSEKVFGWDREAKGRPFWRVRHVLEFQNLSPEKLRYFIAAASLVETSNRKGSPLSTDTHYMLNSCVTLLIAALFSDEPVLQNKPLHELMLKLGELADVIHMSHSRKATMEEFLTTYQSFGRSNLDTYTRSVVATMQMKTLRQSHDGQPPFISCYAANHQHPQNPDLAKLLDIAEDLSLQALRKMVAVLS